MSDFLGGRVLIAMPGIDDDRFERAVILVCAHSAKEAVGITLNRPVDGLTVRALLRRLKIAASGGAPEDLVLFGGPVDPERGFVVHTDDYLCEPSSIEVSPGLALTPTREVLEAMADPARRPRQAILALGYAGWQAGQLEREIQESVWLVCDADEDLLFGQDHERKWAYALNKIGVSADQLSARGGRA